MNSALLRLYHRLPPALRSVAATARGFSLRSRRYGPETEALVREALEREHWRPARWKAWREERLAFVLDRAATRVPYYKKMWRERRAAGERASWERLENWPILRKETLRAAPEAFVAEDQDIRRMVHEHTSGTTGTPLSLWRTRETDRAWYALSEARLRLWNGISRRDRWGMLGGQLVVPVETKRPPFWVWNAGLRQLYMSSYHLAPGNARAYLDALSHYRVAYLLGYASSLDALAGIALRTGQELPMKVAISNAEPLSESQRERISHAFRCAVRDTYGMVEIVCGGSECFMGSLHLWPEAGVTEVVEEESDEPLPAGETGRFLCTSLLNADMPLIRYETGDRGALAPPEEDCSCGRTLPVIRAIEGRLDDVLLTPDGRRIGRLDPVFKADLAIHEAQIVQERLDFVRVKVVPAPGFGPDQAVAIAERMRQRLGPMVETIVEPVDSIPRTAAGKFRGVVSNLGGRP